MPTLRHRAGFSLIELMVVTLILGIVTAQILGILGGQMKTYAGQKAAVDVQHDARLAADLAFYDLRMAGYMVPAEAAIAGADGGGSGSDTLCISDPSVMDDVQVDLATDRFDAASLTANLSGGSGSVDVSAADLDIDGDGDADFAVGSGIIVAEGSANHCARITGISGGSLSFTPATPGGFAANLPDARAVPAIVYERTAAGLLRNGQLLSGQVEDLQVEYGVDGDEDGQLAGGEFPLHGLNGHNASLVRRVRVSVLTRTVEPDPNLEGPGRQAVANRAGSGSGDMFRRRLVAISVVPRNLL